MKFVTICYMVLLLTMTNEKAVLNAQFKSVFTVESNEPLPNKRLSPHPTMPHFNISYYLWNKNCSVLHS